jgi:hypothetical protein
MSARVKVSRQYDARWWAEFARECAAAARKTKRLREARRFDTLAEVLTELAEQSRRDEAMEGEA